MRTVASVLSVVLLASGSAVVSAGSAAAGDGAGSCNLRATPVACPRAVLDGEDLRPYDLTGANLAGANLTGVRWTGAVCPDGSEGPYPCVS